MRKSVVVGGPWRGIIPAASPQMVPDGYLHDCRGFRFTNGRITLGPGIAAVRPLPRSRPVRTDLRTTYVEEDVFTTGTHVDTRAVAGSLVLDCGHIGTYNYNEQFDNEPDGWLVKVNNKPLLFTTFQIHDGTGLPNDQDFELLTEIKWWLAGGGYASYPGIAGIGGRYNPADKGHIGAQLSGDALPGGVMRIVLNAYFFRQGSGQSMGPSFIVHEVPIGPIPWHYNVRVRYTSSDRIVRARAWRVGTTEPTTWQSQIMVTHYWNYTGRGVCVTEWTRVDNHGAAWNYITGTMTGMIPCTSGTWTSLPYKMNEAVALLPNITARISANVPVGTSAQVWFSVNHGATWKPVSDGSKIEPAPTLFDSSILFRVRLTSSDGVTSPAVHNIKAEYGLYYVDTIATEFVYPLAVYHIESRFGNNFMLYVTRTGIYIGDYAVAYDVTPRFPSNLAALGFDTWRADTRSVITVMTVVTDTSEWVVLASSDYPFLFRLDADGDTFQVFNPKQGEGYLDVVGGRHMAVFNDRLVFGSVFTSLTEVPHAIAHYGVWGPFDNSFPTAGMIPLTDIGGPVTGFGKTHDFLVIFKPRGIYVAQRATSAEFPLVVKPRVPAIGCSNAKTIVELPGARAVCFLGTDSEFYIYDVNQIQSVGGPVRNYLQERDQALARVYTNIDYGEVNIVYPDVVLVWNYRENWWAIDDNDVGLVGITQGRVIKLAPCIDDATGIIDTAPGYIDENPGARVDNRPFLMSRAGLLEITEDVIREAWLRTAEIRFAKPYHLARLEIRCRTALGATMFVRRSVDSGKSWSEWAAAQSGDHDGTVRFFYDFVHVTQQVIFEIRAVAQSLVIEDFVLDVEVKNDQEEVTPQPRDFGGGG